MRQRGGILFRFARACLIDLVEHVDAHPQFAGSILAAALIGGLGQLRQLIDQLVAVGVVVEAHVASALLARQRRPAGADPCQDTDALPQREDQSVFVRRASARHQARDRRSGTGAGEGLLIAPPSTRVARCGRPTW